MKIAVASNNSIKVSGHLGRCKTFVVFETDKKNIQSKEIRENTFRHHEAGHGHHNHGAHHEHGGGGEHNHNELIELIRDCRYVIFQSGGWRIIEDLQANGISPILTDEENAENAVIKFLAGELEIKEDNSCRQH